MDTIVGTKGYDRGDAIECGGYPARKKWGTAKIVRPHTVILHSRADDVIPFA